MNKLFRIICLLLQITIIKANAQETGSTLQLHDPSGKISASLSIHEGRLTYSVTAGMQMIVAPSAVGLQLSDMALGHDVKNITISRQYTIKENLSSRSNNAKIQNMA